MELAQKLAIILDKFSVATEDYGVVNRFIPIGSPEHQLAKLNLARLQDAVNDLDNFLSKMAPPRTE